MNFESRTGSAQARFGSLVIGLIVLVPGLAAAAGPDIELRGLPFGKPGQLAKVLQECKKAAWPRLAKWVGEDGMWCNFPKKFVAGMPERRSLAPGFGFEGTDGDGTLTLKQDGSITAFDFTPDPKLYQPAKFMQLLVYRLGSPTLGWVPGGKGQPAKLTSYQWVDSRGTMLIYEPDFGRVTIDAAEGVRTRLKGNELVILANEALQADGKR